MPGGDASRPDVRLTCQDCEVGSDDDAFGWRAAARRAVNRAGPDTRSAGFRARVRELRTCCMRRDVRPLIGNIGNSPHGRRLPSAHADRERPTRCRWCTRRGEVDCKRSDGSTAPGACARLVEHRSTQAGKDLRRVHADALVFTTTRGKLQSRRSALRAAAPSPTAPSAAACPSCRRSWSTAAEYCFIPSLSALRWLSELGT